jgi:hypothetical protein
VQTSAAIKVHQWINQFKLELYQVRLEVFTVTNMKVAVFWDVALCSLVDTDRGGVHHTDDGGSKLL